MKSSFSLSSITFRDKDIETSLKILQKTGIQNIDLGIILPLYCPHYNPLNTTKEDDRKLAAIFQKYNFKVSSLNVGFGALNNGDINKIKNSIFRCFDLCEALNTRIITMPSGSKVIGSLWKDEVTAIKPHIYEIVNKAKERGIEISIEAPHVNTLTENAEEAEKFFQLIDIHDLKCTFDTSHVRRTEKIQLVEAFKLIGKDRINHIHIRDSINNSVDLTPGTGSCDFRSFFQYLKQINYKGFLTFELEYHGYSIEQILNELNFALEYSNILFLNEKLNFSWQLRTNRYINSIKRFTHNPKIELKRHPALFNFVFIFYSRLAKIIPEKVFIGHYKKIIRRKKPYIHFKTNSVEISNPFNKIIRVGIIGLGAVGLRWHAEGFNRLKNIELIGGFDLDDSKNILFSKRYGIPKCKSLLEVVLDRRPDILVVATKEWSHYEPAMLALENGVDVFCEKILASRYHIAEKIVDTARAYNRVLGLNYNYHYMPGIQKIKELINTKALGNMSYFTINVHALAFAHALDLLTFIGGNIKELAGKIYESDFSKPQGINWSLFDENIQYIPSACTTITVEFENGSLGIINSSNNYNINQFILSIEAVFENAVVVLNGINMYNAIGKLSHSSRYKIKSVDLNIRKGKYTSGFGYTFFESIKDFVEKYINGEKIPTDGNQALFNLRMEKFIHESSINGKKVIIPR